MDAASKSRAHFEFVRPDSAKGKEIRNVLVQHKLADELYPHKPSSVCRLVAARTEAPFTQHNHTQAWRHYKVRPRKGAKQPENTKKEFCIYHAAHKDYTFSDAWVDLLVEAAGDPKKFEEIRRVRI
ncbi:MAG: hypothetical protein KUG65_09775 [Sphingomonadaceae bacterium]|nr:hypothetical protein [Sphingomonadaceae bacterium]